MLSLLSDYLKTQQFAYIPFGGAKKIGMNSYFFKIGEDSFLIDAGFRFPEPHHLGVEKIVPPWQILQSILPSQELNLIITHGHDDHIGGLSQLLSLCPRLSIKLYTAKLVKDFIQSRYPSVFTHSKVTFVPFENLTQFAVGKILITPISVEHSIFQTFCLVVDHPLIRFFYSADYLDIIKPEDHVLYQIQKERAFDLCFFDSTGAKFNNSLDSNSDISSDLAVSLALDQQKLMIEKKSLRDSLHSIIKSQVQKFPYNRIYLTLFSTQNDRFSMLFEIAQDLGLKVCLSGRTISQNVSFYLKNGFIKGRMPELLSEEQCSVLKEAALVILTGSQSERRSGLVKLAFNDHPWFELKNNDTVIYSSRAIPGNELRLQTVHNQLSRLGVHLFSSKNAFVHQSGHAHNNLIARAICLIKPRYYLPIHGESEHLISNKRLFEQLALSLPSLTGLNGNNVVSHTLKSSSWLVENGQVFTFLWENSVIAGAHVNFQFQELFEPLLLNHDEYISETSPVQNYRRKFAKTGFIMCLLGLSSQQIASSKKASPFVLQLKHYGVLENEDKMEAFRLVLFNELEIFCSSRHFLADKINEDSGHLKTLLKNQVKNYLKQNPVIDFFVYQF